MKSRPILIQLHLLGGCLFFTLLCFVAKVEAQTAIQDTERPTLLIFSGSDWCIPCIHLEKTVLSDSIFLDYAAQQVNLVKADFPQRKRQRKEEQSKNEALAERYNPEGAFPKILLLHPDQSVWAVLPWQDQGPQQFIEQLDIYLRPR